MERKLSRSTLLAAAAAGFAALTLGIGFPRRSAGASEEHYAVTLTDAQWRARLSPEAYDVLRHEGTEAAGSSPLDEEKRAGLYACAGCEKHLYDSKTKFDSGTGWPSFYAPLPGAVETKTDLSLGIPRTEVHCSRCGGHLGHVFDDGPRPTGLRYCMNGVALDFHPGAKA